MLNLHPGLPQAARSQRAQRYKADLARCLLALPVASVPVGWEVVADRSRHGEHPGGLVGRPLAGHVGDWRSQ
jgi:hypothetical protein